MEKIVYSAKNRPQRLCKMCGKCCTLAVARYSFDELKKFANCPESEAADFLSAFVAYDNLEEPRKISQQYVDLVIEKLQEQGKFKKDDPIFYRCKYIDENNCCSIYENRFGWCKRMPNHAWTLIPCGCGFEGWQFLLREQIKHNIRKLKEYLYEIETLYGDGIIPSKGITVEQMRQKIMEKIKPFERFGSMEF